MKAFKLIVFACFSWMVLCDFTLAQSLSGCSGINQTEGPKVVLDKLEFENDAGNTQILTSEYEFEFLLELRSRLKNLFPDTQPKPVLCANRDPKTDGSDFVPDLVRTLNNRDVLLEMWGTIKSREKNGEQLLGAQIVMVIIPVRYYEGDDGELDFQMLSYPEKVEQDDLETAIVKISFGAEFDVYACIAHGIKSLKNDEYDKAKKYFSNGRMQWETAMENGSLANSVTDQSLVLEYIENLEKETITAAADDPDYSGDLVAVVDVLSE